MLKVSLKVKQQCYVSISLPAPNSNTHLLQKIESRVYLISWYLQKSLIRLSGMANSAIDIPMSSLHVLIIPNIHGWHSN